MRPSVLVATAIMAATLTIRPPWRTLRQVASSQTSEIESDRAWRCLCRLPGIAPRDTTSLDEKVALVVLSCTRPLAGLPDCPSWGWKTTAVMCLAVRAAVVGSGCAGSVKARPCCGFRVSHGKRHARGLENNLHQRVEGVLRSRADPTGTDGQRSCRRLWALDDRSPAR